MNEHKTIEVVAAIIRKGDAIFATQRGYGEWKDYWEAPGGKVEPGESPVQALRREIREELDTEISVDKFLTTIEWDYPKFHLTMHCYMCSLLNDALHLNEHEAARWLRADELRSVNWLPADDQLLPLIEQELKATSPDLARARTFIDSHEWHFAKTMPQIPHWYCLRKDKGDVEEFLWFARYIQEHSTPGQFYGNTYYYFYLDGYKYWSMDERPEDCDLINRDKVEENPYAIVREEKWTEDINGIHIVHTKSYDAQDRVVGVSTVQFRGDKNVGHSAQCVEADGYWHGGAYDEETGMGCQIYRPFVEGEIQ